jgi:MFS family permease
MPAPQSPLDPKSPRRPPGRFGALIAATGPAFLIMAFLSRLPSAMAPLGLITLVVQVTGSYAQAGVVTAALGIGAAAGGPVVGFLSDRIGQRSIGLLAAITNAAALAITVFAVVSHAPTAVVVILAALVGLSTPQIGPLVRVRWVALLAGRGGSVSTAMSYEGAVDEASFVAGPALVGILALTGIPALPLIVAAVLTLLAAVPFALHRTAVGRAHRSASGHREPLPMRALVVLIAAMAGVGMVFGGTQTGVSAFAESIHQGGAAGLIYAVLGVGSALAGFGTAYLPARFRLPLRLPLFALALLGGTLTLLAVSNLATAMVAMAVLGVTAAPVLVTVYALAEKLAPAGRIGVVMTLLASGVVGGVALGAGIAGPLAGAYGYSGAFAVPIVAGLVTLLVAALGAPAVVSPRTRRSRPALELAGSLHG